MKNTYYYQTLVRDLYTGKKSYIYTTVRYFVGVIIGNYQVISVF